MVADLKSKIPGPDRQRTPSSYSFTQTYQADLAGPGCLARWEVHGGRERYFIDLEQLPGGWRQWHCTCADAVFRAGPQGRACKHVLGLIASIRT